MRTKGYYQGLGPRLLAREQVCDEEQSNNYCLVHGDAPLTSSPWGSGCHLNFFN